MLYYAWINPSNSQLVLSVVPAGVPSSVTYVEVIAEDPSFVIVQNGSITVMSASQQVATKLPYYLNQLGNLYTNWIYSNYSQVKQSSDLNDYVVYTSVLYSQSANPTVISATMNAIGTSIATYSLTATQGGLSYTSITATGLNMFNNYVSSLTSSFTNLDPNALIQLAKIAVRNAQVNVIKGLYKQAPNLLSSATSYDNLVSIFNSLTAQYTWIAV